MTLGEKLARLRRENNFTQEQLAELLRVSRQAVSKWESDAAYPETEKLIRLGKLYHCSMDYLLLDKPEEPPREAVVQKIDLSGLYYERVSERRIGNLPLWHINIGYGRVATGVFALGLSARGIVAVGLASLGVVSVGIASVGLLALGCLAVGLLAAGAICTGVIAAGAIAVGIFSLGAMAIGDFSVGALAIGRYAALGDAARSAVAVGHTEAEGTLFQTVTALTAADIQAIRRLLADAVPWYLRIFENLFLLFLG